MVTDYLERGVAAGALAGLGYGVLVALVANPLVAYLEGLDGGRTHTMGHEAGHVVPEATAAALSVGGAVLWGILLGAAFGVGYYVFEPTLPGSEAGRVYVLAGAGFLIVSVTPWLVLPPVVPGEGPALRTDVRVAIYGGLMLLGACLAAGTLVTHKRLSPRLGWGPAAVVSLGSLVTICGLVASVAPTVTTGGPAPGELGTAFRGLVVLGQASLWALLATSYRWFHVRAGRRGRMDDARRVGFR